jgi:hypothetical protein
MSTAIEIERERNPRRDFCKVRCFSAIALLVCLPGLTRVAHAQGVTPAPDSVSNPNRSPVGMKESAPQSEPAEPEDNDYDLARRGGAPTAVRRAVREHTFALLPVLLELRGGVSTIVGLVGVTASFDPFSRLTLGAGFGANTSGMQFAGFARVRPLIVTAGRSARLHAVGVELGYSTGPFRDYIAATGTGADSTHSTYSYDRVQWLQPQITYETRSYRGFNLLAGVGVEIPLKWQGYQCIDPWRCGSNHIGTLPTITFGVGWAMGLDQMAAPPVDHSPVPSLRVKAAEQPHPQRIEFAEPGVQLLTERGSCVHRAPIMAYMLMMIEPVGQRQSRTEAEGREAYARMVRWGESLRDRGLLIAAESLRSQSSASRLQVRAGKRQIIDGPFLEAKEMIGGFFLVNCATQQEAIALASECPAAEWLTVEVRGLAACFEESQAAPS